jgi:acylglycerol lipase
MVDAIQRIALQGTDLVAPDGIHLRGEVWQPAGRARASIVIAHGKDEHIGRYRHVINALTDRGYTVFAQDHRGHGKSDGRRGVIERFDDYVDDLDLLVAFAKRQRPDASLFLLGHSMGGLIAARYALAHQEKLDGLILSGAALRVGDDVPTWQKKILMIAARLVPSVTLPASKPGILSRDPEVERAFAADPLCNNERTKLGFVRELYIAAEATANRGAEIHLPLLVMHGADDKLTNPPGSQAFYEEAVSNDKTLKFWPEDRHEIFNEIDKADVIAFVIDWLDARTSG